MSGLRTLAVCAGAAAACAALTLGPYWYFARDHGSQRERLDGLNRYLEAAKQEETLLLEVDEQLDALAAATLGSDLETVDHELRQRLNRIGERCGLSELLVNTARSTPRTTPARSQLSSRSERKLRDEVDFVELEGTLTGVGSLEAALAAVDHVRREPWMKHLVQLRLTPRDNGERFTVMLRLNTLFLPGRSAEPLPPAPPTPLDDRLLALIAENPFRLPSPAPPPAPPVEVEIVSEVPDAESAFVYREWAVTAVVEGPQGAEVWLLNQRSMQPMRLQLGGMIHELVLASTAGDQAEFRRGEERIHVAVGQNLEVPVPMSQ